MPSGALVLACNVSPNRRTPFSLALSKDNGLTWPIQKNLETGPGVYGYCSIIRARDTTGKSTEDILAAMEAAGRECGENVPAKFARKGEWS